MSFCKRLPILLLLLVLLGPSPVSAEERYTVSLVTMFPGDALFSGFGHIAFRIEDRETGADDVYDYGTYDYEDPNLAWKFLIGTLPYYCQYMGTDDERTGFARMVDWYAEDFGGILVQELALTEAQIEQLRSRVGFDCRPENAAYKYHHFHNNCATKLRDILDPLLRGELGRATQGQPSGRSLRELIDASLHRWQFAVTRWAVFGLLNWYIDRPADRWSQMFLPWYLSHELDGLTQPALPGNPPLVRTRELVCGEERPAPPDPSPWFGLIFTLLSLLACAAPFFFARRAPRRSRIAAGTLAALAGLTGGFYGSLLVFSCVASPYPETFGTLALLCFHPAHFFLIPAGIGVARGSLPWTKWARYYVLAGAVISSVIVPFSWTGLIPQRIWHYALCCAVVSIGLFFSLHRLSRAPDSVG